MGRIHPEIFFFGAGVAEGRASMRNLLGGKGANLAEMASIGLPVPPGFTICTEMCQRYYDHGGAFPDSLRDEVAAGIGHIEGVTGRPRGAQTPERGASMVRDPVCGTFVIPARAVTIVDGRTRVYFCSESCRDKYRAKSA